MKSYDYEAVAYDGDVYCLGCLPEGVNEDDAYPIFADSEWDYYPVCCVCGGVHDYVNLTLYGQKELQRQRERQIYRMGDISPRFGEFLVNPSEEIMLWRTVYKPKADIIRAQYSGEDAKVWDSYSISQKMMIIDRMEAQGRFELRKIPGKTYCLVCEQATVFDTSWDDDCYRCRNCGALGYDSEGEIVQFHRMEWRKAHRRQTEMNPFTEEQEEELRLEHLRKKARRQQELEEYYRERERQGRL